MPLHDAFRINCKNGATTENQEQVSSIWAKGPMFDDCVCVCDMTTPPWWREKVMVYYYFKSFCI